MSVDREQMVAACASTLGALEFPRHGLWVIDRTFGGGILSPELLRLRGLLLLDLKRFDEAAACLQDAIERPGSDPRLRGALSDALHGAGRTEDAISQLQVALEQLAGPDLAQFELVLARRLIEADRVDEAEPIVRDLVITYPGAVTVYVLQADLEKALGHPRREEASLRQAAALLEGIDAPLERRICDLLIARGETQEAARRLFDVLRVVPGDLEADKLMRKAVLPRRRMLYASVFLAVFLGRVAFGLASSDGSESTSFVLLEGALSGLLLCGLTAAAMREIQLRRVPKDMRPLVKGSLKRRAGRGMATEITAEHLFVGSLIAAATIGVTIALSGSPKAGLSVAGVLAAFAGIPLGLLMVWDKKRPRKRALPRFFDSAVCHCGGSSFFRGHEAIAYRRNHLAAEDVQILPDVDRLRCPVHGTSWIALPSVPAVDGLPEAPELICQFEPPAEDVPMAGYL